MKITDQQQKSTQIILPGTRVMIESLKKFSNLTCSSYLFAVICFGKMLCGT